jgi:hypothetical protein
MPNKPALRVVRDGDVLKQYASGTPKLRRVRVYVGYAFWISGTVYILKRVQRVCHVDTFPAQQVLLRLRRSILREYKRRYS